MKRTGYCCEKCGVKASAAKAHPQKVECHHKNGIKDWDLIIDTLHKELFCASEDLQPLFTKCHEEETNKNGL